MTGGYSQPGTLPPFFDVEKVPENQLIGDIGKEDDDSGIDQQGSVFEQPVGLCFLVTEFGEKNEAGNEQQQHKGNKGLDEKLIPDPACRMPFFNPDHQPVGEIFGHGRKIS